MIDSHFHLDYLKADSRENLIAAAQDEGVQKFMTISVSTENLDEVISISQNFESIYCTQGIHPHDAKDFDKEVAEKIIFNTKKNSKVLAIGEIGLDYHYDNSPREIQKTAFETQLQIASDLNKPIVIHTREAEDDTKSIMKNAYKNLAKKGVFHSFTSQKFLAEFALDIGFFIGFNGIITFKNAHEVREIVEMTPLDRILLETDSPFLTPSPHRGKENSPKFLKHIALKIAEIKNISFEEVSEQTTKNFNSLFLN